MTPAALAELVRATAVDVLSCRGLDADALLAPVTVEPARNPEHGDYASNVALRSAGRLGVPPREFAGWLAEALNGRRGIASAEVAGPGFLNMRLAARARGALVGTVLAERDGYGRGTDTARVASAVHTLIVGQRAELARLAGEIGTDAARYALIRSPVQPAPEIDRDVWSRHIDANPSFLVRHAHARLASVLRGAADLGIEPGDPSSTDLGLLTHDTERQLIRTLGEFPAVVTAAAGLRQPYRVARYLEELAHACHGFQDSARVLPQGDQQATPLTMARLQLCTAARRVLAGALGLIGINAPERI